MCVLTATHAVNEVLVRFEGGMVYVAFERSCGCTGLRPATSADLGRGLALLESTPDAADEDAGIHALALVA